MPAPRLPGRAPSSSGDRDVAAISAASILAKTARDALLVELDAQYPVYGFARTRATARPSTWRRWRGTARARSTAAAFAPVVQIAFAF